MKKLIVLIIAFASYAQLAHAQEPAVIVSDKPGWHKIGEVKADFVTENQSIIVYGKDKFKSIKLKVTDAPIEINNVTVYYEDDKTQSIPVASTIASGSETKVYTLQDPLKELKKVTFVYKTKPNYEGEKAHVELYGLK